MMKKSVWFLLLSGLILVSSCSRHDEETSLTTWIHGSITVDPEVDASGDYGGIELLILEPERVEGDRDTIFYARTDRSGSYAGEARFETSTLYSMSLSRRGNELAQVDLVLAENDTIHFDAELPDIASSYSITSAENDLFASYNRLRTGVNRLYQFAGAGAVSADTLNMELRKWGDLFWDLYQENPDRYAGRQAALSSIQILDGLDPELMISRLHEALDRDPLFIPVATALGTQYYAEQYNLDRALAWIDTLQGRSEQPRTQMNLEMTRIKLLYDSARVDAARLEFDQFRESFGSDEQAADWIDRFEEDLQTFAPGSLLPDFQLTSLEGDTLTRDTLIGSAYVLEFSRLDSRLYQDQFDRSTILHHIYKNYGIDFITVPIAANESLIDAFFEERPRLWTVIQPETFDPEDLRNRFNLNVLPTRILVDREGRVVRKYEGTEYSDIIRGFQSILTTHTEEEPS